MDEANVTLSQTELEMLKNEGFILTKNEITRKIQAMLAAMIPGQQQFLQPLVAHYPLLNTATPKISKGEKYKGLPYLVLDYPRIFDKENILAIRTMCYWGNFFSTTLHLSGIYLDGFREKLVSQFASLVNHQVYTCVNDDPWQHDFSADNYREVKSIEISQYRQWVNEKSFIKLALRQPLAHLDNVNESLLKDYQFFTAMLAGQ
jgi:hypothetical protein